MAKQMLVTLPFVLLLLDIWPLKTVEFDKIILGRILFWRRFPFSSWQSSQA